LWVDIDNDGDLDLISAGKHDDTSTIFFKVYTNNITIINSIPFPPIANFNPTFNFSTGKLILEWSNGSDIKTPTLGLYYNLRVGTCSGCHDVVSGVYGGSSNPTTGYFGNMMQRKRIILNRPDLENKTIYWVVQTIDTGLAKSNWSTEQVYNITQSQPEEPCTENWTYGEWAACSGGQQARSATDLNDCNTTVNQSATTQSCTSYTSPFGGSPSDYSPPPANTTVQNKSKTLGNMTWYFEKINENVDTGFILNQTLHAVNQVWIRIRNEASEVYVDVKKLAAKPSVVAKEPKGNVYQYLNITFWNLSVSNVELGKIRFDVDKKWIINNSINKSTIALDRYYSGEWQELKTSINGEDENNVIYLAETPGFSVFAITGEKAMEVKTICKPVELRCNENILEECSGDGTSWTVKGICAYGCENAECKGKSQEEFNYTWIILSSIIIVVVLLSSILLMKREKVGTLAVPRSLLLS
jgi:PGF-pre-PGF domain-containing protein